MTSPGTCGTVRLGTQRSSAQIPHDVLTGIYVSSFRITLLVFAVILAIAGALMYWLLSRKKANVPVEEFSPKSSRHIPADSERGGVVSGAIRNDLL